MPRALLAASHQEAADTGEPIKSVINCYSEPDAAVEGSPMVLRCLPGVSDADTGSVISGNVRGLFQADGFANGDLLVVDGATLRKRSSAGAFSSISGSLPGSDRVRAAFSETEAAFLANGQLYVSSGASVAAVTDPDWAALLAAHGQTQFSSVASLGQRMLVTYGSQFAYSAVLDFNTTTALSFYTAERFPDGIIAGVVHGEEYVLFGTESIEPWVETGNVDAPFTPIPGRAVPDTGALCRDAIVSVGLHLLFVDQDRIVRRLFGVEAEVMGPPWVTRILHKAEASEIVGLREAIDNHIFYTLVTPYDCVSLDLSTGHWHRRRTLGMNTWRWAHMARQGGRYFAASRDGGRLGLIDDSVRGDLSDEIVMEATAHPRQMRRGEAIGPVVLQAAAGVGEGLAQSADPVVALSISRDGGQTFGPERLRSLGKIGEYGATPQWNQCGRARKKPVVLKLKASDPVNRVWRDVLVQEAA